MKVASLSRLELPAQQNIELKLMHSSLRSSQLFTCRERRGFHPKAEKSPSSTGQIAAEAAALLEVKVPSFEAERGRGAEERRRRRSRRCCLRCPAASVASVGGSAFGRQARRASAAEAAAADAPD